MSEDAKLESADAAPLAIGRGKGCITVKQLTEEMDAGMARLGMATPRGQGNGWGWGRHRKGRNKLLGGYEQEVGVEA